jgi:D-amino-acid dehydrogenase
MKADSIVLGAGIVGISAALALQARGRSVVLVDRRPAAEETSFGNSGLIQREGVVPYAFPRDVRSIVSAALNLPTATFVHWRALPSIARPLYGYWRHGTADRIRTTAWAAKPLVERSVEEHEALMQAAGIAGMMRRTGYLKVFRSRQAFAQELEADELARRAYGIGSEVRTGAEAHALEPHLTGPIAGAILMPQPVSVADPAAVGRAYAELFVRRGGAFVTADANTLSETTDGWQVQRVEGPVSAPAVVVALGPWSGALLQRLGVRLPFFVKRGYHMHYRPLGHARLTRPVIDGESGYVLAPMTRGVRLTTGAEFTTHLAPPTPVQLDRVEPLARALFPLGDRLDMKPWLGARPCFPDMLPMVGEVPGRRGLWLDTGHHHLGFTLGPVTGRLLAEMLSGGETLADPEPYRVGRFG